MLSEVFMHTEQVAINAAAPAIAMLQAAGR